MYLEGKKKQDMMNGLDFIPSYLLWLFASSCFPALHPLMHLVGGCSSRAYFRVAQGITLSRCCPCLLQRDYIFYDTGSTFVQRN
jgi:hypothetical protein